MRKEFVSFVSKGLKTPKSGLACWAHITVLGELILKNQPLNYVHKQNFEIFAIECKIRTK